MNVFIPQTKLSPMFSMLIQTFINVFNVKLNQNQQPNIHNRLIKLAAASANPFKSLDISPPNLASTPQKSRSINTQPHT
jgi:hypothetical protein